MENLEETDNITKNIVQEIVRECKKQKLETDENFCVYYVKLLTLDPLWKISPEKKLNRENIQNIVTFIIKKLKNLTGFDLVTLKIQHVYLSNATEKEQMLVAHKYTIDTALKPLREDILAFTIDDNKQTENKLFKKIGLYITLKSGLGNPKHPPVLKEAIYALKSIFEDADIPHFVELKPDVKDAELKYFQNLVAGIRLFHRDCGRASAEIEDLPKLLSQALTATLTELQDELLDVMEEVNLTTSAIDNIFVLTTLSNPKIMQKDNKIFEITRQLEPTYPDGITFEDVQDTINLLILARQREVYIRRLLQHVKETDAQAKTLFNYLQEVLKKLHNVVKYKVAISTNIVYPLFIELAATWRDIQDQAIILSTYSLVFEKLNNLNLFVKHDFDKLKIMIGQGEILTDAMRLEKTMGMKINKKELKCTVLTNLHNDEFNKIPLQYLGFCVWSLVQTDGGLIPGNPNIGICCWKHKYYVFSSPAAAAEFGIEPDMVLMQALSIVRKKPELINLLQLHDSISQVRDIGELYEKPQEVVMMVNSEIQTEVHPIPEYIDPDYVWNTWDYYRQAIKLANISGCRTHSMQALKSHFRCPAFVQTVEPRDKICQTKKDNYVNVATPSNFIFGLRGRQDDVQHIVELTRPVDEEAFYSCATAIKNPPPFKIKPRKCKSWKPEKKDLQSLHVSHSDICHKKKEPSVHLSDKPEESLSLDDCICVMGIEPKNK